MRVFARAAAAAVLFASSVALLWACQVSSVSRARPAEGGETAAQVSAPKRGSGAVRSKTQAFPPELNTLYDHFLRSQLYAREAERDPENAAELRRLELEELRQASRLEPNSGYIHALLADRLLLLSSTDEAQQQVQMAIKKDANIALAYLVLGKMHGQRGQLDAAAEAFRRCLEIDPANLEAKAHLVDLYQQLAKERLLEERYTEAIEFFERALELAPFRQLIYLNMAYAYNRLEEYEKAIELYQKLRQVHPTVAGKAEMEMLLGETYYRAGRFEEAYHSYGQVLQLNAQRWQVRRPLGLLAFYLGRYAEAVEHLSEYYKKAPEDWEVLRHLGMAYGELGQPEQAIALLERLREQGQAGSQTYVILAELHSALGQPERVESLLKEAIETGEDQEELYYSLGVFQYEHYKYAEAEESLLEVLELNPQHKPAMLHLALTYDKKDRLDRLEEVMRRAIALDADFAEALNLLGYALADRGVRLEEAEALVARAAQLQPDAGFIIDSLGWVYYRQGRYAEAIEQLERAAELMGDRPDWVVLDHLGDAYWAAGQGGKAAEAWAGAVAALPLEPNRPPEELEEDMQRIQAKIKNAAAPN